MKKLITFLLAIIMVVLSIGTMPTMAEEGNKVSVDFENSVGWDIGTSADAWQTIESDDLHGKSLQTSGGRIAKVLKKSVSSGIFHLSFEYNVRSAPSLFYVRFFNSKLTDFSEANIPNLFETCVQSGNFGYYPGTDAYSAKWVKSTTTKALETKKWYKIDLYADWDVKRIYYYIDDEFFASDFITKDIGDIKGVSYDFTGGQTYLDNIVLEQLDPDDENLPDKLKSKIDMDNVTSNIGHIFFDNQNLAFDINLINKENNKKKLKIVSEITNGGHLIKKDETTVDVEAKTSVVQQIKTSIDKFGFFDFSAKAIDDNGNVIGECSNYRFSVVNCPEEGKRDEEFGVQVHGAWPFGGFGDPATNLNLSEKLGISFVRADCRWEEFENTEDHYAFSQPYQTLFDAAMEKEIKIYPVLFAGNPKICNGENPPHSPEAVQKFADYAKAVIAAHPYHIDEIEVWNEWTNGGMNAQNLGTGYYANLLKETEKAIKEVSPDTRVWSSCTTSDEEFVNAGGLNYCTGVAIHPYNNKGTPEGVFSRDSMALIGAELRNNNEERMPLYASEVGWPSVGLYGYPDEEQQAAFFVRTFTLNKVTKQWSKISWYSSNNGGIGSGQEQNFGMLRAPSDEIAYEAKPIYLAAANYESLMMNAEYIDAKDVGELTTAYRFKLEDGRDALLLWTPENADDLNIRNSENVSLSIDASQVEVYDMYGNSTIQYASDGKYSFNVDGKPIYIVGYFDSYKKADKFLDIDINDIDMVKGDKAEINIASDLPELSIELELPDNASVIQNDGFIDGNCRVIIGADICDRDEDEFTVNVLHDGNKIFSKTARINYVPAIEISQSYKPYGLQEFSHWYNSVKIKSNTYDTDINGKLKILSPSAVLKEVSSIDIKNLKPGMEKNIVINIPAEIRNDTIDFKIEFESDNFEKVVSEYSGTLNAIVYAKNAPTIDGNIESGEWETKTALKIDNTLKWDYADSVNRSYQLNSYRGNDDLSGTVYTAWDFDNLYMAVELTDDVLAYDTEAGRMWAGDSVQFGIVPEKGSAQNAQVDFAVVNGENRIELEVSTNGANVGPMKNSTMAFKREGNISTYEVCMPWKDIFPDGILIKKNGKIYFSIMVNDNDGYGRKGWLELGSGIGRDKNSNLYLDFFLLG